MKILVTGSNGFIGKWVLKELKDLNYKAIAFPGDVCDMRTFPKGPYDMVIHLAAKVDKKYWRSKYLYKVNVEGTKKLLKKYSDSKFIYISSTDTEKVILSEYGKTKKAPEGAVLENPNNLVIKLPSVFGPGDKHNKLIPRLFKKYLVNEECRILNNNENEYMYVEDIAMYIVSFMYKKGVIRPEGFKIRNSDLSIMIRAVCKGEKIRYRTTKERHFIFCLEQYLLHLLGK